MLRVSNFLVDLVVESVGMLPDAWFARCPGKLITEFKDFVSKRHITREQQQKGSTRMDAGVAMVGSIVVGTELQSVCRALFDFGYDDRVIFALQYNPVVNIYLDALAMHTKDGDPNHAVAITTGLANVTKDEIKEAGSMPRRQVRFPWQWSHTSQPQQTQSVDLSAMSFKLQRKALKEYQDEKKKLATAVVFTKISHSVQKKTLVIKSAPPVQNPPGSSSGSASPTPAKKDKNKSPATGGSSI